jgi:hypothetical protein
MRGPIDFIVVGFEGNNFKGEILKELNTAVSNGVIAVLALGLVIKDEDGTVTTILENENELIMSVAQDWKLDNSMISEDDTAEVGDLLENNTSAGLLIVEHLWAKPLKQAIINANGVLVADGRIHPDAVAELK